MKFICVAVCVISILLIQVFPIRSGPITPNVVQRVAAESKAGILTTLLYLENSFLNKTDPDQEEIIRNFESLKEEVPALTQRYVLDALELCGEDTSLGEDSRCPENPMRYLKRNMSKLKDKVEMFVNKSFAELNRIITVYSRTRGPITPSEVQTVADERKARIMKTLLFLENNSLNETDPDQEEIIRKFESFKEEVPSLTQRYVLDALKLCRGNTSLGEDSLCLENPMRYLNRNMAELKERVELFVKESFVKYNRNITEYPKLEEVITSEDVYNTTFNIYLRLTCSYRTLYGYLSGETNHDLKESYKRKLASFAFELDAVYHDIYRGAIILCTNRLFCEICLPCYKNPMKYIERRFKPLYQRIEKYKQEIISTSSEACRDAQGY